jgi:hypothetical protein
MSRHTGGVDGTGEMSRRAGMESCVSSSTAVTRSCPEGLIRLRSDLLTGGYGVDVAVDQRPPEADGVAGPSGAA